MSDQQPSAATSPATGADKAEAPRKFGIKAKLLALALSFSAAFTLVEACFQLFVNVTDVPFYFWDPAVGLRHKPNERGQMYKGRYIHGDYNFNAQGWNYPKNYDIDRPEGTLRVCLIGDSYVEALQISCKDQMAVAMEQALDKPDRPAQCYPFGSSGYGTGQEYNVLRHYVLDYKPDFVIIFFVANDLYDCSPYLAPMEPSTSTFALDDDGELQLMQSYYWQPSFFRRASANLAVARYFMIQQGMLERMRARNDGPTGLTRREVTGAAGSQRFLGADMTMDERGRKSWQLIERILAEASADCRRAGAALGLVYYGCYPEIQAARDKTAYAPIPKETDPYCTDKRYPEMGRDFLQPIAERLEIPYLDMTETLKTMVVETGKGHNFPDDDHYNALSHAAAGKAMARWVEDLIREGKARVNGKRDDSR